jgi:iron(III) transport system ATP-binding protein
MVFQDYALFPHLSVWKNVTFGLNGRGKKEGEAEAARLLQVTGLAGYEDRYPHELSGGERQRVALARALAPQPVVVLLDEPFSSLDADRRGQMRAEVRSVLKESGATAIFVTHDQEEALYMGDRLAVLNRGCLEQADPPEQVFHFPRTRFVAEFMGQTDFVAGEVTPEGIRTELGCLRQITALPAGAQVEVAVRPDDLKIAVGGVPNAVVESSFFRGSDHLYRLRLRSGQTVHAVQPHTRVLQVGTRVRAWLEAGHPLACFEAEKAVKLLREPGSRAAACFAEQ